MNNSIYCVIFIFLSYSLRTYYHHYRHTSYDTKNNLFYAHQLVDASLVHLNLETQFDGLTVICTGHITFRADCSVYRNAVLYG
jgi:hypothetical protein